MVWLLLLAIVDIICFSLGAKGKAWRGQCCCCSWPSRDICACMAGVSARQTRWGVQGRVEGRNRPARERHSCSTTIVIMTLGKSARSTVSRCAATAREFFVASVSWAAQDTSRRFSGQPSFCKPHGCASSWIMPVEVSHAWAQAAYSHAL